MLITGDSGQITPVCAAGVAALFLCLRRIVDFKWKVYPTGEGQAYHGITTGVYVLREGNWGEVLEVEHVTGADEELIPNKQ